MPQVRAEFNYQPSADAQRYEIFYGTQRLGFSDTLQFTTDLELEYGTHNFSVRGVNIDGTGPFRSTQVVLEEPYVPLPTPGSIGALEVSLVILGGGVGGGEPPVVPPSGDPYDLTAGGTRTIPALVSSISFPTEPTITSTVEVLNDSQLAAQLASPSGKRIQVRGPSNGGSATYSTTVYFPNSSVQNVWIDVDNDATISSTVYLGEVTTPNDRPRYLKWSGGFVDVGASFHGFHFISADDVIIDNVNITSAGNQISTGVIQNRFLLMNTTLNGGATGFNFMGGGDLASGYSYADFIIANLRVIGSPASNNGPFRQGGAHNRFIMVDSHIDRASANSHFRFHGDSVNWWIADNAFDDSSGDDWAAVQMDPYPGDAGAPDPAFPLGPGAFENNSVWIRYASATAGGQNISIGTAGPGADQLDSITATGNRCYLTNVAGANGSNLSAINGLVTASNNVVYSFDSGSYVAPVSASLYGADH